MGDWISGVVDDECGGANGRVWRSGRHDKVAKMPDINEFIRDWHKPITGLAIVAAICFFVASGGAKWLPGLFPGSVLLFLIVVFLPLIVAAVRGHQNALAIGVLNTTMLLVLPVLPVPVGPVIMVLGWIAALVWSFTADKRSHAQP